MMSLGTARSSKAHGHCQCIQTANVASLPFLWEAGLTRIVIWALTELFFVTIVLFAGEKCSAVHVLSNIGFEGPVLIRA